MEWYYSNDGERSGPLNQADFDAAVAAGTIVADTLVWHKELPEWMTYSDVSSKANDLSLKSEPEAHAPPTGDTVVCRECGTVAAPHSMAPYGDQWVCAGCKDHFYQKIREGVTIDKHTALAGTGGRTPNAELMANAREALQGKWGMAVGTMLLFIIFNAIAGGIVSGTSEGLAFFLKLPAAAKVMLTLAGTLLAVIVQAPLLVGISRFFLNVCDGDDAEVGDLFSGFNVFGCSVSAIMIRTIVVQALFLPGQLLTSVSQTGGPATGPAMLAAALSGFALMLLFLPIMIFLSMSWWLTEWVIADSDGELSGVEALTRSWKLMAGNRFKLFCLFCRFIGWVLLCIPTLFIGLLWVWPYTMSSVGMFYRDVQDPE